MTKKSVLALLLVLTMCLSLFPSVAFAAEDVQPAPAEEEEEIVQNGEVEVVSEIAENGVIGDKVTVTFLPNGGVLEGETSITVTKGEAVPASSAPTASKEGEAFENWYIDFEDNGTIYSTLFVLGETPVNKDTVLTAHYCTANLTEQQQDDIKSNGSAVGGVLQLSKDPVTTNSAWSGSGTKDEPYVIDTAEKLSALATEVNAGTTYTGVYFKVTAPIAVTNWTSIGTTEGLTINGNNGSPTAIGAHFAGFFDGGNQTISGLTAPLFGAVNGATVSNVTISGANISGTDFVGALVGYAYNSSITGATLTNVTVSGKHYVGGAIAYAANTAISGCNATTVNVSADDASGEDGDDVGGLVGYFGPSATMSGCSVSGGTVSGQRQVGGLAGISSAGGTISNCSVTGVTVKCITNANTSSAKAKKIAFGGMVGSFNSGCGAVSGNVSNVILSDGNGAVTTNVRRGFVTGGPYETGGNNVPALSVTVSNSTIEISTADQLAAIAAAVNAGDSFAGNTVKLMANITLTGTWTPIGTGDINSAFELINGKPFAGTFDGNGKTISGLSVNSANAPAGLFGVVANGGSVKNVKLAGATVSGGAYVGAVAGIVYNASIDDCDVSGEVSISGSHFVGGIAGYFIRGASSITKCDVNATGTISAYDANGEDGDDVGGIVGYAWESGGAMTISNCSVSGVTVSAVRQGGGIAGLINAGVEVSGCTVSNVIVEVKTNDKASTAKKAKIAFGGAVGAYCNGGNSISNNSVTGVTLKVADGAVADNARLGLVTGGVYNTASGTHTCTLSNNTVSGSTLEVSNAAQLEAVAAAVNAGDSFADNTVKLMASFAYTGDSIGSTNGLSIDGNNGSPKSESTNKFFAGTFNGNSQTISGLTAPLFGAVENKATVKDLTISGANISGGEFLGALASYTYDSTLTNVDVISANVSGTHFIGGAVGYAAKTAITDVDVSGTGAVAAADDGSGEYGDDVGGVAGYVVGGTKLTDCNVLDISVTGERQTGGLVGLLSANSAAENCSVNGVNVICKTTDKVVTVKGATKIGFGGLAGAMHSSPVTVTNCTVANVTLSVDSSVSADAKAAARIGKVTGGTYTAADFAVTNANQTGSGITVTNVTKPAGTAPAATESALIDGPHEHTYGAPTWEWKDYPAATATFKCNANDSTVVQPASITRSSNEDGKITATATAADPNGVVYTDTKVYTVSYVVTDARTEPASQSIYSHGVVAHFKSEYPVDWLINGIVRAKACTDFYFAVTEPATVTTEAASTGDLEVIAVKKAVGGTKSMTYQVQWSLPATATNVTATIYRCRDDAEAITSVQALLNASNRRTWECNMDTRNGDFTYNVIKLTSGSKQTIMLEITYWLPGESEARTVYSDLTHIAIS